VPPSVKQTERVLTPLDAFILSKLEAKGLSLSPEAEARVLVRRVHLDLIGLPPSPQEVDDFLRDTRPNALERLIDRLLASPHFGERWGRHWLDGAGYVDVLGGDNDAGTIKLGDGSKWKYRDHVVRAVNEDRPWKRFLTEQIAGDELIDWRKSTRFTPEIIEKLVATGFLRTAADDTDENELNTLDIRHGVQQRTGEVLASNLLGLTLNCAKCHNHKFEPITQRDYYRLMAILGPAFNPHKWLQPGQRVLAEIPQKERTQIDEQNALLDARIKELLKRTDPEAKQQVAELQKQKRSYGTLQAVYDVGPPTPTHLLKRGNHDRPGEEIVPGFLSVLCATDSATALPPSTAVGESSGRRLALANWLCNARTPAGALAARVRVNRIWQHLFGRGIVVTADNLGLTGAKPTHPELLEWLAVEFVDNGGRLKPLLKLLMMSSVYRQASAGGFSPVTADPDDLLLWRMRLRRQESEAIRDSLLIVSGQLDTSMGGPPVPTESRPDGSIVVKGPGGTRRTLYLLQRRNYHPTVLGVFDQPVLTTNCTGRSPSAVVLQSLTMLNDSFVREQADHLARRVEREAGSAPDRQIALAFAIVLGRPPRELESTWCGAILRRKSGLARLCHVLLNTNEFLYVP
jgi:hypothetical protein